LLAIIVRIDILFSPIGLIFIHADNSNPKIHMFKLLLSYIEILFLLDVIIRSVGIYRELKEVENWRSKLFTFTFMYKTSIPIFELIIVTVRLFVLSFKFLLTNPLPYFISVLWIFRWLFCADPISFWLGLTKLDSSKRKSIANPINAIITVILLTNLAACVWMFIGSEDLRT